MNVEENNEAVFPIRFEDLTLEAQKRLLEFIHAECPAELNYDVFPITVVSRGDR
jgi:hypothetical protein